MAFQILGEELPAQESRIQESRPWLIWKKEKVYIKLAFSCINSNKVF